MNSFNLCWTNKIQCQTGHMTYFWPMTNFLCIYLWSRIHIYIIQAIRLKFARWNPLPLPFVHKLKSIYCLFMYLWIKISQIKMKIPPTAPTPTMRKAENVFNKWNYLASISLKIYVIQCFLIWNRRCRIFINSPIPTCSSWSTFFGGSSHSQYSNGTS